MSTVGKATKFNSPFIYCVEAPAPAILIVPLLVIGEPVIVSASPVSVKPTLSTVPIAVSYTHLTLPTNREV